MHRTYLPTFTADPGLLAALTQQAELTATAHHTAQRRALGIDAPTGPVTVPARLPVGLPPDPAADSWAYNVGAFLRLIDTAGMSHNPYNARRAELLAFPVLGAGWTEENLPLFGPPSPVPSPAAWPLAPGRGALYVNETLELMQGMIIRTVGYDRHAPVLLDRHGRILDGFHRLLACARLGLRAYFVQLDY